MSSGWQLMFDYTERMVQNVFDKATPGDPESVFKVMDQYAHEHSMHVGNEKAIQMEAVIEKNKPKILVELGGYLGYSAVRFAHAARKHNPEAHYYSVELNPIFACIMESIAKFAGLSDAITVLPGDLAKNMPVLKKRMYARFQEQNIDFLLLDHWAQAYVPDLKFAQSQGLFKEGTVVVAEHIILPGAPEYHRYMELETTLYTSTLKAIGHDAILISYVN